MNPSTYLVGAAERTAALLDLWQGLAILLVSGLLSIGVVWAVGRLFDRWHQ